MQDERGEHTEGERGGTAASVARRERLTYGVRAEGRRNTLAEEGRLHPLIFTWLEPRLYNQAFLRRP